MDQQPDGKSGSQMPKSLNDAAMNQELGDNAAQAGVRMYDFTPTLSAYWVVRRVAIFLLLCFNFLVALGLSSVIVETYQEMLNSGVSSGTPMAIVFPLSGIRWVVDSQDAYHLVMMMSFGFLGGLFTISREFLRTARSADYTIANYALRPLQGALMSVFIYFVFRAGEVVFYSGGGGDGNDVSSINIYALIVLAIVTGMFSEQAFQVMAGVGKKMLKTDASAQPRPPQPPR